MEYEDVLPVQDIIVAKLMTRPLKSNQIQEILQEHIDPNYNHVRTRAYMRALEANLQKKVCLLKAAIKDISFRKLRKKPKKV